MHSIRHQGIFIDQSSAILKLFAVQKQFENSSEERMYSIIWNRGKSITLNVDGISVKLNTNNILTLTPSHHFTIAESHGKLLILQFNDGFYCVEKHDHEVSCIGHIFYGANNIITIRLNKEKQLKFDMLFKILLEEFKTRDNVQREMLTVLLKRLIIKCTRIAKEQYSPKQQEEQQHQLIRRFNILVEIHFKQEHNVSFYAKALSKSPKTLANLFLLSKFQSPLTIIRNRILTEARRQLLFTQKSVKEISYDLGFNDIQTFSRFYKMKTGISPTDMRKTAKPSGS